MKNKLLIITIFLACLCNAKYNNDDTQKIQKMINSSKKGDVINGNNKTYNVTALWLKSGIHFKNFILKSIPTDIPDVSVLNIGNDLKTNIYNSSKEAQQAFIVSSSHPGIQNITIDNVKIDGSRFMQKGLDIRDGGKHGIAIKGFVSNIRITNVQILNCATDGIMIYRGLHTNLIDNAEKFAANNIFLENVSSSNNRRHGGSGDSINTFICKNSSFTDNGKTVSENAKSSKGAIFNNKLYGNGWDMEGYGLGSSIQNVIFQNTIFVKNIGSGLLFYDTVNPEEPNFIQRKNIKIIDCRIDKGEDNPSGDYALIFTSSIKNKLKSRKLYKDILINNTILDGKLLLRSVENIQLTDISFNNLDTYHGLLDSVSDLRYKFIKKKGKQLFWEKYYERNIQ